MNICLYKYIYMCVYRRARVIYFIYIYHGFYSKNHDIYIFRIKTKPYFLYKYIRIYAKKARLYFWLTQHYGYTVCPRSSELFFIVTYYLNGITTSWTDRILINMKNIRYSIENAAADEKPTQILYMKPTIPYKHKRISSRTILY